VERRNDEFNDPDKAILQISKKERLKTPQISQPTHTSATLLLYAGVNIKQVQGRLGHGDIETTNKYLHLIEEADVEAANKLDIMLLPKSNKTEKINTDIS
jgi:integrase